jgi:4-hydroxybenzoate polyprenyltransferase/phosphoserine phosphatase
MDSGDRRVLCVDLDGTLVSTDLLWESLVSTIRRRPLALLSVPLWLVRGRAHLKQRLAETSAIDFATLPYRADVLAFVDGERRRGRQVVLATAAHESLAHGVAEHLGIFSEVIASDGVTNLKGSAKAASLTDRFGRGNFDYIGDSSADVPIWKSAGVALSAARNGKAHGVANVQHVGDQRAPGSDLEVLIKALRPHQWLKNLLILVPAMAAHRFDMSTIGALMIALASLSLCASGGYILNDLLDVAADRQHPRKRHRPLASGRLSLSSGIWLILACWTLSFGLAAALLPPGFSLVLGVYLLTTAAYSLRLKREPVLDVMVLAGLYVTRVIAGGSATNIVVSTWLLAFTLFISISLAFLKRFVEVSARDQAGEVPGRGYMTTDAAWLHAAGLSSAYLAVVILAIYVNNAGLGPLYRHPNRLLVICPVMLYWSTSIWLKAHRRTLHDDPVVAVAGDRSTYVIAAISAAIVLSSI